MNSAVALVQEEEDFQRCPVCGELKPPSAFYGDIDSCKSCVRTRYSARTRTKIRSIEWRSPESNISNPDPEPQQPLEPRQHWTDPDRHPAYELIWVLGRLAQLDEIAQRRWEVLHQKMHTAEALQKAAAQKAKEE
jgi:hypothetical protein